MDDIKLFAKSEKEVKPLKKTVRLYTQDREREFDIEIYAELIMKSGKRHMTEWIELPNQEKLENSKTWKPTQNWEY